MSPIPRFCAVGDCLSAAWRGELCRRHYERLRYGETVAVALRPKYESPVARLTAAATALAAIDAHDDDGFVRAQMRLVRAAEALAVSRGYTPPKKRNSEREERR